MRTMPASRFIYTLFLLSLVTVSGCILSPEEDVIPPDPTEIYKPLTDKENVIYNLVQCYKYTDINKYEELLHPDYIWYNQEQDYLDGKVPTAFYSRSEDIDGTNGLFKAKMGIHEDPLAVVESIELVIQYASWFPLPELEGNPCDDCWETSRIYELTVVVNSSKTLAAYDLVKFIVVPVIEGEQKIYKLRRGDDILSSN